MLCLYSGKEDTAKCSKVPPCKLHDQPQGIAISIHITHTGHQQYNSVIFCSHGTRAIILGKGVFKRRKSSEPANLHETLMANIY